MCEKEQGERDSRGAYAVIQLSFSFSLYLVQPYSLSLSLSLSTYVDVYIGTSRWIYLGRMKDLFFS